MRNYYNIYQDEHSGGWIVEVLIYPRDTCAERIRLGVYGSREFALRSIRN